MSIYLFFGIWGLGFASEADFDIGCLVLKAQLRISSMRLRL